MKLGLTAAFSCTKDKKKEIRSYDVRSKKKVIVISIKKRIKRAKTESIGAKIQDKNKSKKKNYYNIKTEKITRK